MRRCRWKAAVTLVVTGFAALGLCGCSRGDDAAPATSGGSASSVAAPTPVEAATSRPSATQPSQTVVTSGGSVAATTGAPVTEIPVVPETGVPGLDSEDAFCAAWSRFGGTWQVLLVGANFLGDPAQVAAWEVSASQAVLDAYDALAANFPDELAAERDDALDGYFGALQRRALAARAALADAGAAEADAERLAEAWLDALAARDPTTPDLAFGVPDDLAEVVDRAAAELLADRTEFGRDPSLVVGVETPLTDAYLETTCPDRGTLAGGEVGSD